MNGTVLDAYDEAGHLLGEYDGTGGLIEETVWLADTPIATLRPTGSTVSIFYIHSDALNTPRQVTRPSDNTAMWTWNSDPFGTDAANPNPAGAGTFAYNLRSPGQQFDGQAGLHQNVYRDYDPAIGRYAESDWLGLRGGINTYSFVMLDPLRRMDRLGLESPPPEPPGPSIGLRLDSAIKRGDVAAIEDLMEILSPEQHALAENAIQRLTSTANQLISRECRASVRSEFPKEVLENTLEELMQMAKEGDKASRKALKLLNDLRFKK